MSPTRSSTDGSLNVVDKLVITFLVDDCIEWMTKLPPGFTHELPTHLTQHNPPIDEVTGVPILDFNTFCCGAHGFAALIETQIQNESSYFTLFDTGPDSLSLKRNVTAMQVPLEKIDRVVISHWHSDHTGGLLSFLKLRNAATASPISGTCVAGPLPCIVDLHPDRPIVRGIAPGPTFDKVICALPRDPTFELIEGEGGVIDKHLEGHTVAGGTVWVSGEVPRVTPYEQGILGGLRWVEGDGGGRWTKESHIMDERYVAVDVAGKGLIIFSACSHSGIVNIVKDAIATFSRPIYMILGGLHLAGPEFAPRIPLTVDFLSRQLKPSPTYILPMHCSGFQSKIALEAALGEGCVAAGVGLKVEVIGNRAHDGILFPPVY